MNKKINKILKNRIEKFRYSNKITFMDQAQRKNLFFFLHKIKSKYINKLRKSKLKKNQSNLISKNKIKLFT